MLGLGEGKDYAFFIAVTLQNVGGSGLLGVRDSGSGSDGEDIHGSGGGKGCLSSGSSHYTFKGSLSAFSQTRPERRRWRSDNGSVRGLGRSI